MCGSLYSRRDRVPFRSVPFCAPFPAGLPLRLLVSYASRRVASRRVASALFLSVQRFSFGAARRGRPEDLSTFVRAVSWTEEGGVPSILSAYYSASLTSTAQYCTVQQTPNALVSSRLVRRATATFDFHLIVYLYIFSSFYPFRSESQSAESRGILVSKFSLCSGCGCGRFPS